MGRRVTKNFQRFVYDGYLQIANFKHQTSNIKLQTFIWDPTEPVATRPLVWNSSTIQPFNFSTSYYVHDGNKNVSEVVAEYGDIAAHYEYAPFGAVTMQSGTSSAANLWRFSSECAEDDTATVYYNYRFCEPESGRWGCMDPVADAGGLNLYGFVRNQVCDSYDVLGMLSTGSSVTGSVIFYGDDKSSCEKDLTYVSDGEGYDDYEFFGWLTHLLSSIPLRTPSDFDPNQKLAKCECVRDLLVISHGGYKATKGAAYVNWGDKSVYESEDDRSLSNKFLSIRFCKKCKIELRACYIGKQKHLRKRLEETGCEIVLYDGLINPVDGGPVEE